MYTMFFLFPCDRVEVRPQMAGTRLAFNEAHGVNIPESKEVTQPDISLVQSLDTAGSRHETDAAVICMSAKRQ